MNQSARTTSDFLYTILPIAPLAMVAILFVTAGIFWSWNGQEYQRLVETSLEDQPSESIAAVKWKDGQWVDDGASEKSVATARWLRLLDASQAMDHRFHTLRQHDNEMSGDASSARMSAPMGSVELDQLWKHFDEAARPVVDEAIELAQLEQEVWFPESVNGNQGMYVSTLRELERLSDGLSDAAMIEYRKNETERTIEIFETIDRLQTLSVDSAVPVGFFTGSNIHSTLHHGIGSTLQVDRWNDEELESIAALVTQLDISVDEANRLNREFSSLSVIQQTAGNLGDPNPTLRRMDIAPSTAIQIIRRYEKMIDGVAPNRSNQTPLARRVVVDDPIHFEPDQWLNLPIQISPSVLRRSFSHWSIPAHLNDSSVEVAFTQALLEARRFERARERWPRSLDELVRETRLNHFPFAVYGWDIHWVETVGGDLQIRLTPNSYIGYGNPPRILTMLRGDGGENEGEDEASPAQEEGQ